MCRKERREAAGPVVRSCAKPLNRRGCFEDSVVHSYIEAPPRRCSTEPADPKRPSLQSGPGLASANVPCGKAVRGGRDSQTKSVRFACELR